MTKNNSVKSVIFDMDGLMLDTQRIATKVWQNAISCIVLEDSFAGIKAAYTAKMIPIMVPDLLVPTDEITSLAYAVVPTLNEAKIEIESLIMAE